MLRLPLPLPQPLRKTPSHPLLCPRPLLRPLTPLVYVSAYAYAHMYTCARTCLHLHTSAVTAGANSRKTPPHLLLSAHTNAHARTDVIFFLCSNLKFTPFCFCVGVSKRKKKAAPAAALIEEEAETRAPGVRRLSIVESVDAEVLVLIYHVCFVCASVTV